MAMYLVAAQKHDPKAILRRETWQVVSQSLGVDSLDSWDVKEFLRKKGEEDPLNFRHWKSLGMHVRSNVSEDSITRIFFGRFRKKDILK